MSRTAAPAASALSFLVCAMLAGCAAPGEPTARHPVVPVAVSDLSARQYGNAFALTFTLPTRSMDREALSERPAVDIYRAALPPGASPDKKTEWRLAYSIPSEKVEDYLRGEQVEFRDPLTADNFAAAAGSSIAYRIRTRMGRAEASLDSNFVVARAYPPPEPPRDVKAAVTKDAIEISWTDPSALLNSRSAVAYRVYREEEEPPPPDQGNGKGLRGKAPLALLGQTMEMELLDRNFEFGRTYVYSVRSVAQYGGDTVESDQPAISMATVTPRDVFPPAVPTNLEITIVPATNQASAYIELSWAISSEGDLAGYLVYRSDGEDTPGERINAEILPSPTFRDISVLPGRRYSYRVSAVDRAGNESPKSSAAQADVP